VCRSWGQTEGFARACVRDRPRNVAGGAGVCRSLPPDRPIALLVHHEERWRVLGSARFRLKRSRGCGYPPNVARPFGRLSPCTRAWAHPWCRNAEAVSGSGLRGATTKRVSRPTQRACFSARSESDDDRTHGRSPVWPPELQRCPASYVPRTITTACLGEALSCCQELHTPASARNLPRAITNQRMGKALFGPQDLHTHAPFLRSENDHNGTHGRSPVWPRRLHTHAPLATSRERSRTGAWAKPCLAGRPTALVRTYLPRRTPRVAARLGWSFLITP
jgi:hypothetical protein